MRPYLRVANVYEDRLDLTDVKEMNFSPKEYEVFRLEHGDVLLNEGQSPHLVGRPAIWRGEIAGACFQNTLIRFRAHAGVVPGFALAVFRAQMHLLRYLRIAQITTNIAHLSAGRFAEVEFPLPPTAEQHRITLEVEKQLTRLDAAVATLKAVQAKLKRARASVLKAAVEGRLVRTEAELARAEGRPYEPASALLGRILAERHSRWPKDKKCEPPAEPRTDDLPELPEGWTWATCDAVAAPEPGAITDGPFGSHLKTGHYVDTGPRVLRLQNVGDDVFRDEHAHISLDHYGTLARHKVEAGDIIIASLGTDLPKACVVPEWVGPAVVKADVIRLRTSKELLPAFVSVCLNSPPVRSRTKDLTHGVGRPRLGLDIIRSISLPLSPTAEQARILTEVERRLSVLGSLEHTVEHTLARCGRLRQSILKRAFEGNLVPQHPADEPASELLARIRAQRAAEASA